MNKFAIIGGTGLASLNNLTIVSHDIIQTPYGEPSGPLILGEMNGTEVLFLARHGPEHTIPPHRVNYRANLWALQKAGATHILAINAVGGISSEYKPMRLAVPDQLIDYTHSRDNTFFDLKEVVHIDFTEPYCNFLRNLVLSIAANNNIDVIKSGTYAATQGPRLESIAEITKLEKDGCDIVGMTGMPEAALAKELDISYACLAVVANFAAGKSNSKITMDIIEQNLVEGMVVVKQLLEIIIPEVESLEVM